MIEPRTCAHCGTAEGELTEFNGRLYCEDCLDDLTLVCTDCGSRFLRTHNRSENDDFPICPECYDRDYTRCVRCGRIIDTDHCWYPLDNDDPYCADCCSTIENSPIHDYYFKPYPIFYGDGPRYFGVELEIDDGGECDSSAEALMDVANQSKMLAYCKHDGSLDDGFEIVTYPMSLDCQLHEMPWAEVLDKAIGMGYLSHQAGTCGLHVHVSRKAFGDTLDAQDNAIARVLFFVERHWAELLRFSRRTQRQLEQWAARYGYCDQPHEMLEHVKKGRGSRYTCVNLTNVDTIEFRMFRGTLKLNTLIATLQLVDHICDAASFMSDDELHDLSWSSFVSAIKEPELVQYLKERNLYINEPVEREGSLMCYLFGIYDYGHSLTAAQKKRLVSALAVASEDRGTDATGIAYNHAGHLTVYKRPYPAHLMHFRLPEDACCIMGHTRMTTQGDGKHNYNNHPFEGTEGIPFALAHNGVLYNDLTLRKDKKLPRTRIETDSHVVVQLLAQQDDLSFRSIRSTVESLRGTLTLSVLDSRDNLYIIKGNNPLTLYHFPRMGLYVYASTEQILKKGLKKGMPRMEQPFEVMLREGDILRIDRQGQYTVERFDTRNLWDGTAHFSWLYWDVYAGQDEYINDLKSVASAYGYTPHDIDVFLGYGLCPEEIEEIMCCGEV